MKPERHFLLVSFQGTRFAGWQRQKGQITVQETIENALIQIIQRKLHCAGCSRTDAGVHALKYYAHVDLFRNEAEGLLFKLKRILPSDIQIMDLMTIASPAHAQRDSLFRIYRYFIHFEKNPFLFQKSTWIGDSKLDLTLLDNLAKNLTGEFDFYAFCKRPNKHQDTRCQVLMAKWSAWQQGLVFEITANRFLKNMVRLLVGNMLYVASDKLDYAAFKAALQTKIALPHFVLAPPEGLYLADVIYPEYFQIPSIADEQPYFPFLP